MDDNLKVVVYDIECYKRMFLYCGINVDTNERYEFEISPRKNEMYSFIKYLFDIKFDLSCGYNNISYDSQVIQYILDESEELYKLSTTEIVDKIYEFSVRRIDDSNYELKPPYKELYLDIPQLDLFKIHHYDNKNRRISLKKLEFSMNSPDIEEIPVAFDKDELSNIEMDQVVHYCWNDVKNTLNFYFITRGKTENELYKGDDKVQIRLDVMKEQGFTKECLNWSNTKIGDEINLKGYCKETGLKEWEVHKRKKNREKTKHFNFGECIPDYVKFKTVEFNKFYNYMKAVPVSIVKDKRKFPFSYNGTNYTIAQGGIHSCEKGRILKSDSKFIYGDADVGAHYSNAINKRGLYPSHLGPKWNINYNKATLLKGEYKILGKTDKKYKNLEKMQKECLNAGAFGKTNENTNWQYGPEVTFNCTIGNQFEILMIIEMLELEGFHVVSANTDGFVTRIPIDRKDRYFEICHEWERIVGNDKSGQLEYTSYKMIAQTSINHYLAIDIDGKIKLKGDFAVDVELHKDNSMRIVPIAIKEYFVNGVLPEVTIHNCKNIYHFCIGNKASKDYFYRMIDKNTGKIQDLKHLIRYYCSISKNKMEDRSKEDKEINNIVPGKLYKIKVENSDKKGPRVSQCQAGSLNQVYFNTYFDVSKFEDYGVDYKFYENQVNIILDKVDKEHARDRKLKESGAILLF